jgi:ABC-2 type transport system permease protein
MKKAGVGTLAPYGAMFRISFKNTFAYRASVLTGIVGSLFSVVAQVAVWRWVFRQDQALTLYMTRYVIISQVLGLLLGNTITGRIGDRVYRGDLAVDLIRPGSPMAVLWSASFGESVSSVVIRGLPVLVVFSPAFLAAGIPVVRVALFLSILLLSFVLANEMFILLGYLSLVVLEVWPFVRLLNDTIRLLAGAVIPLAFFPSFLGKVAAVLPFQYLYSLPVRALLEDFPPGELLQSVVVMGGWITVLAVLSRLVSNAAVRRIVVQGG